MQRFEFNAGQMEIILQALKAHEEDDQQREADRQVMENLFTASLTMERAIDDGIDSLAVTAAYPGNDVFKI